MPNSASAKQRPVETLDHGIARAAIWKNSGPNGTYYAATFSRAYTNAAGTVRNSASFKAAHIADLAALLPRVSHRLAALNAKAFARLAA